MRFSILHLLALILLVAVLLAWHQARGKTKWEKMSVEDAYWHLDVQAYSLAHLLERMAEQVENDKDYCVFVYSDLPPPR